MYESLKEHCSAFHLYIFAFDDLTESILKDLKLEYVTVVSLAEFETEKLLEVKKERTKAEYCWTCTPSVISFSIEKYNIQNCTYLDSDLCFFSNPAVLVSELDQNNKNVLITEHRFSFLPRLYEEKRAGRFCVQFVTFRNEPNSLKILEKWRQQCIDWCYARHEDGKFGDQKYLDEWPSEYSNIHILQHQGGGVAPWNLQLYRFKKTGSSLDGLTRKTKVPFKVVFYHFQYVKFLLDRNYDIGWYYISSRNKKLFYTPYLEKIIDVELRLSKLNNNYKKAYSSFKVSSAKDFVKKGLKSIFGYNILKAPK